MRECILIRISAVWPLFRLHIHNIYTYKLSCVIIINRQPYWYAKVRQDQCMVQLKDGECHIYFSVCQSLPYEVCEVNNTGFCQKIKNGTAKDSITLDAGLSDRVTESLSTYI